VSELFERKQKNFKKFFPSLFRVFLLSGQALTLIYIIILNIIRNLKRDEVKKYKKKNISKKKGYKQQENVTKLLLTK